MGNFGTDRESRQLDVLEERVFEELARARDKFKPYNSAHEGYAVILEELDELWEWVKLQREQRNESLMAKEALQVAATALRFILDVCPEYLDEVEQ